MSLPSSNVVCPTSTPATSVIAFSSPVGKMPTVMPAARTRGLAWPGAPTASSAATAIILAFIGISRLKLPFRGASDRQNELRRFSLTNTKNFVLWVHERRQAHRIRARHPSRALGPRSLDRARRARGAGRLDRLHHSSETHADHGRKRTG